MDLKVIVRVKSHHGSGSGHNKGRKRHKGGSGGWKWLRRALIAIKMAPMRGLIGAV